MTSKVLKRLRESVWPPQVLVPTAGRYTTRICAVIVWCIVLWTLIGDDAFPREYIESIREDMLPCIVNYRAENNSDSKLSGEMYSNTSGNADQVTVHFDSGCPEILEALQMQSELVNRSFLTNTSEVTLAELASILSPDDDTNSLLHIPDGHFFGLAVLLICASISGFIAKLFFLPSLFGMIISGIILQNVPYIDFASDISPTWSSTIRNIALVIVLIRGGLSLKLNQLKRLKLAVFLLGVVPCVLEGAVDGVVATFYLRMPWQWAFMLGYLLAAISPSIVVPTMLTLQEEGYGTDKGIPTLVVAAASIDVVIAISLFGIFLGLAFSEGHFVLDIFRAPIQITVGLLYGIIFGFLLWMLPTRHFKSGSKVRNRFMLILGLGLIAMFGTKKAILAGSSLAGAGALAVVVLAFVAGQGWNKQEKALVSRVLYILWQLAQPLLFGLIGTGVDLDFITPSLVGQGVVLIIVGLTLRVAASSIVVLGNGFTLWERILIAVAWLPKATVQAAIGSVALDLAIENNEEPEVLELGREVLTIAVLAIVMTAPLGAIAVTVLGRILLKKSDKVEEENQADDSHSEVHGEDQVCNPMTEIVELDSSPGAQRKAAAISNVNGLNPSMNYFPHTCIAIKEETVL